MIQDGWNWIIQEYPGIYSPQSVVSGMAEAAPNCTDICGMVLCSDCGLYSQWHSPSCPDHPGGPQLVDTAQEFMGRFLCQPCYEDSLS